MREAIIDFLNEELPVEPPVYDMLTDTQIPVSVRGRMAHENYKRAVSMAKELGAVTCEI